LPLLIGGATTSRAHTAVKIAPHYRASTVHVLDASRAVGVVNSLLNEELKSAFDKKTREEYERLRQEHAAKTRKKNLLTLDEARANRTPIDWSRYVPPEPEFLGVRVYATSLGSAGCQPAVAGSLPATSEDGSKTPGATKVQRAPRQAAEMDRLAACAPQTRSSSKSDAGGAQPSWSATARPPSPGSS